MKPTRPCTYNQTTKDCYTTCLYLEDDQMDVKLCGWHEGKLKERGEAMKSELPETREAGEILGRAKRYNGDKLRWRNFPDFLVRPVVEAGQNGEGKYGLYNFLKGAESLEYHDCIKRHLAKYYDPSLPDIDEESGVSHLAHVAWNAMVAIWVQENMPELDNRFKMPEKEEA